MENELDIFKGWTPAINLGRVVWDKEGYSRIWISTKGIFGVSYADELHEFNTFKEAALFSHLIKAS